MDKTDRRRPGNKTVIKLNGKLTSPLVLIRTAKEADLKTDDGGITIEMAAWALDLASHEVEMEVKFAENRGL